jgi:hypothetical protein
VNGERELWMWKGWKECKIWTIQTFTQTRQKSYLEINYIWLLINHTMKKKNWQIIQWNLGCERDSKKQAEPKIVGQVR